MTENKRFTLEEFGLNFIVNDNGKNLTAKQTVDRLNELFDENEQLKKELEKFKKWEKHIRDIKREDLDRVFKMSIYEIAEAFEYYQKRINELEE